MSAPYIGNPTSAESPSLPPGPNVQPTVTIPADPDGASWANIQQLARVPVDWTAYFNGARWTRVQELYNFPNATISSTTSPLTTAPQMQVTTTSGSVAFQDAGVGTTPYYGRSALITLGSAGGNATWMTTSSKMAPFLSSSALRFCFETDVAFANASAANNAHQFGISDTVNLSGTNFCMLINIGGVWNINYSANSGGYTFGPTPVSPAMSPSNNTFQRLRMCLYGASTPEGVAAGNKNVLNCYINDTLVFSNNPTTLINVNCFITQGGIFAAGASTVTIGSWFYNWTRY